MENLFLTVFNMSLVGGFVILAIIIARLLLKRAPKTISYCLWIVAGLRLLLPFSIESALSLVPFRAEPIQPMLEAASMQTEISTQVPSDVSNVYTIINESIDNIQPAALSTISNPTQPWITIGTYLWVLGFCVMLIYGIMSYLLLKRRISSVPCNEDGVYESESVKSPFVLGIFDPKIFIPTGLSATEHKYIIHHEQIHIKRRDHIIKFAAYFILCLHWFNPLAWAAFLLMGIDMEMSCDERILKEMGITAKKDYSLSLIKYATGLNSRQPMRSNNERAIRNSPLGFSEDGLKARIKNVLKFKKHSRITVIAAILLAFALSVGLLLNGVSEHDDNGVIDEQGNLPVSTSEEMLGPGQIEINNKIFSISASEVDLDYLTVTDADLMQLRHMTNLKSLSIFPSQRTSLLWREHNDTIDISLIADLTGLTELTLSSIAVSDLRGLAGMTNLSYLALAHMQVDDFNFLAELPNLETMYLSNIQSSDFNGIAYLTNLTDLYVSASHQFDVNMLSELINLRTLNIHANSISDISGLAGLVNLVSLDISFNSISDISALADMRSLTGIQLHNNPPTANVRPLAGLPDGSHIYVSPNQLTAGQLEELRRTAPNIYVNGF